MIKEYVVILRIWLHLWLSLFSPLCPLVFSLSPISSPFPLLVSHPVTSLAPSTHKQGIYRNKCSQMLNATLPLFLLSQTFARVSQINKTIVLRGWGLVPKPTSSPYKKFKLRNQQRGCLWRKLLVQHAFPIPIQPLWKKLEGDHLRAWPAFSGVWRDRRSLWLTLVPARIYLKHILGSQ